MYYLCTYRFAEIPRALGPAVPPKLLMYYLCTYRFAEIPRALGPAVPPLRLHRGRPYGYITAAAAGFGLRWRPAPSAATATAIITTAAAAATAIAAATANYLWRLWACSRWVARILMITMFDSMLFRVY